MKIKLTCKTCGNEFEVIPCRKDTAKYCCKECANKALRGDLNCECEICGKKFHLKQYQINRYKHHTCSKECLSKLKSILYSGKGNHQYGLKGKLNASFKGDEITHRNNHLIEVLVYCPNHPRCDSNGRVTKHRLLVEQNYKKFDEKYFEEVNGMFILKKGIEVHHINFNHNDNRIENLIPVTKSEHRSIHNEYVEIMRDETTGKITGVLKQGELLGTPEADNQQPSLNSNIFEGSETNSRVLNEDSNTDTSALLSERNEDIVRSTNNKRNSRNVRIKSLIE